MKPSLHFAFIAPPFTSHVRALEALAGGLLDHGHRVSWIHQTDVGELLTNRRIAFHAVGLAERPRGSLRGLVERAARPGGPWGLRRVIADVASGTDLLCREAPAVLEAAGVDVIVADQMEAAGGLLAEGLRLPFVSVACALPVNREDRIPLPVMPWGYASDERGLRLNEGSSRVYDWLMEPHARVIRAQAARFGLEGRQSLADCLSPLLQISQTTTGFDFSRPAAPAHFHAVGPLRAARAAEVPLALSLDAARPFVFASLGTLQGGRFGLFRRIAHACRAEELQLLIAHCDRLAPPQADALLRHGATAVTGFAPQRAALARADLVVTHAGLNTAMDALEAGTPQLALPIAFDQPGVAARLVHAGTGLRLLPPLAGEKALRRAMRRLLDEPAFATRSAALGREIAQAGGVARAVGLIESALKVSPHD
ncbi:glycosyltransferase [Xylophilus sp. GOD-11R]|uniref:glycosyltransferase n=1 Tax=Xylophilus sp. GOD-11R TaxID=3089814 RepID=UPI00298C0180|nr:glycosyltransferase [Xylophilus sp. GOD-11R]WPB55824.1 glycosyltransferase [Xylophilus sp. GOD-11R]